MIVNHTHASRMMVRPVSILNAQTTSERRYSKTERVKNARSIKGFKGMEQNVDPINVGLDRDF